MTCFGRASHTAAARATGINAIAKAAKAVLALEQDIDKYHPAVGKPVISINTISAGVAHNVVPGECTFSIDRRLIPGETRESAVEEIVAALDAGAADGFPAGARAKLDAARDYLLAAPAVTRVVRDLPVPVLDDAVPATPRDPERLVTLCDTWGLESPLNRFLAACQAALGG